jgi:hypothetical protein
MGHLQIAEFPKLYAGADAMGKEWGSCLLKSGEAVEKLTRQKMAKNTLH